MFQNFRLAMAWVHTWFGLVLGFVLMAAFFFGTLSVFDREIDRWAMPETRIAQQPLPSFDRTVLPLLRGLQPDAASLRELEGKVNGPLPARFDTVNYWDMRFTRDPLMYVYAGYEVPGAKKPEELAYAARAIVPTSGRVLHRDQLFLGTGFFYPLHFNLTVEWKDLGAWIVGLSALMMLAALVSGVVMHRKFFREFFTFRPRKSMQRSTLDLHNMTGVLALPFHFFFAFTGLIIFAGIYFPVVHTQLHPLHELHERMEAAESPMPAKRAGTAAPPASVDAMVAKARSRWTELGLTDKVEAVVLVHVDDANGYVFVGRSNDDRLVPPRANGIYFKASTGEVLRESPPPSAVKGMREYLDRLHLVPFRHWGLRWLYVIGGLMGCVCIATGFIFFVEKRKQQHAKRGTQGSRAVDALAVTTVTGMLLATFTMLVFNRLASPEHGALAPWAFWGAWVLAMAHAFVRSAPVARGLRNPAWREQCAGAAVLAVAAVLLNWVTTGDHLVKTLTTPYWPVAGVDLCLLASAAVAALVARKLAVRPQAGTRG
jgi:uncharacterized iron-regulated membrane protein